MFDTLLSGRLRGAPKLRTAANGSPYATFRLGVPNKSGESLLCSCVTFSKTAIAAIECLDDGDSIAVTGEAAISTWNGSDGASRYGLDVVVHGAMSAYHVGRKRKAAGSAADQQGDEA